MCFENSIDAEKRLAPEKTRGFGLRDKFENSIDAEKRLALSSDNANASMVVVENSIDAEKRLAPVLVAGNVPCLVLKIPLMLRSV